MAQRLRGDGAVAAGIAILMFLVYNVNGREIANYDSQATKFAARELLLRGTTSLNYVVGRTPQLLERTGFQLARDGRYRAARSPVPAILAAAIAWPLWKTGALDVRAPRAPAVIAKIGASLLVALAVGLVYLIARQQVSTPRAVFIAVAFGLGTGVWPGASQTLWQHETVILGLTLAVFGLTRKGGPSAVLIGLGVGLAASARMQALPSMIVVLAGTAWFAGWRAAAIAAAAASVFMVPILIVNVRWFGSLLGAAPMIETLHQSVYGRSPLFRFQWDGIGGLLMSPNRGILIFSPVVGLALAGLPRVLKERLRSPAGVCLAAAFAQFMMYACYKVWWGGHTYGPRYMLDVLPLLIPLAIIAATVLTGRVMASIGVLTLAYSILIAGRGAFCYPHERWNSDPVDVDQAKERVWDWSDLQIARVCASGPSPQNFSLFTREAFRVPQP